MDVRLSPEQEALRASVAQVVDRWGPQAVGHLDDAERLAKLEAAVRASGWRELRAPGFDGAPLGSGVEAAIIAEELGRGLADVSFLGPTLAAEMRRLAGAGESGGQETVLLDHKLSAIAGSLAGAVAIDAGGADTALFLERSPAGRELTSATIAPGGGQTDLTRPSALPAEGASAGPIPSGPMGSGSVADGDVVAWSALGLALTCADLVGVMRGAIELATEYALARRQYGTAIGSFQAVQHLLADSFVAMEGSRSVALYAAWSVDALGAEEAMAAAAVAKAYCARAALSVCETTIQVHGGIGNTWDCLAHVFLRRALLSTDILGGVGPSLTRVLHHNGIGR